MPQITDQKKLKEENDLHLVSVGPQDGIWRGEYLKCPRCNYFVLKGAGYDECECGNISIDSDMLRVTVEITDESNIEVFNAIKKSKDG